MGIKGYKVYNDGEVLTGGAIWQKLGLSIYISSLLTQ